MSDTLPITSTLISDSDSDKFDLVELLLAEQQSLTAVERFSVLHEQGELETSEPAQARYYRSLLPATAPGPGQQFAFEVDLDSCSGCKACVVACHTMNGLEENETWRRVGLLTGGGRESDDAHIVHTSTACHHCVDPGCLSGCPVKAYDKDPQTGIVRHLDDQCIGCQYCTMMCPYEVPQYSHKKGIVRKCDMCHQRLAVGEAPACVQACPNEAIRIRIVDQQATRAQIGSNGARLVPGAPLSAITVPTTTYKSRHSSVAATRPQDAGVDHVAESHWPLALMLVMTQLSVGMLAAETLVSLLVPIASEISRVLLAATALIGIVGAHVALLHLGRPHVAFRAFLGFRTSWMSREILIFGGYMGAVSMLATILWLPAIAELVPAWALKPGWVTLAQSFVQPTRFVALATGLAGVFSSAMIYSATRRPLWRPARTMTRFFGSLLVLGPTAVGSVLILDDTTRNLGSILLAVAVAMLVAKIVWEWKILITRELSGDPWDDRSRNLAARELSSLSGIRLGSALVGVVLLGFAAASALAGASLLGALLTAVAVAALIIGEVAERLLFFTSVVYDRMPGALR